MRKSIVCLFVLALTACGGSSPNGPSGTNFSGTWSGTVTDNVVGTAPARVTLTQSGNSLSGTWSAGGNSGQLAGSLTGSAVSATLSPSDPRSCPFTMNTTVSGNRMTGTYASFNCRVAASGTIDVSKQ